MQEQCKKCGERHPLKNMFYREDTSWVCIPCGIAHLREKGLMPTEPVSVDVNDAGDEFSLDGIIFKFT